MNIEPNDAMVAMLRDAAARVAAGDYDTTMRVCAVVSHAARRFASNPDATDAQRAQALAAETIGVACATGAEVAHPIARPAFYATGVAARLYAATVAPNDSGDADDASTMMRAALGGVRNAAAALDAAATLGANDGVEAPSGARAQVAGMLDALDESNAPRDIVAPLAALLAEVIDGDAMRRFADDIGALALMLDGEALAASLDDADDATGSERDDV
jgi:hypothetical protein